MVVEQADLIKVMETKNYIVWLDGTQTPSSALVGSKAANLARLARAGLPVPDAFCVTAEAYDDFCTSVRPDSGAAESDHFFQAGEPLLPAALPSGLWAQILEAYGTLCRRHGANVLVAVRSSASLEDLSDASFAGQYASVLNVLGEASLLEALRQCWTSATSRPARVYYRERAARYGQGGMAAIVQVMVPADCAGVLFTMDPLTNDPAHMVVEATPGLGDVVASGTRIPLCLNLDRQTGVVVPCSGSGIPGDAEQLQRIDWKLLQTLAIRVEELFNSPQDIEWAHSAQKFWLLQSRPITNRRERARRCLWTRANAGEILSGVVSPLTWSIFKPALQSAGLYRSRSLLTIHWKWQHPSGAWPDSPRLFLGRMYMDLGSVYTSFANMPGVSAEVLGRVLGFEFHLCRPDELPIRRPRWHVMDPVRALSFWLEMLGFTEVLPRKAQRWLNESAADRHVGYRAEDGDPEALLHHIDQTLKETGQLLGLHIQCTSMAFGAFGLLDQLVRKVQDPLTVQDFEGKLLAGFEGISTVQQGIAIWDLAQAARHVPCVLEPLLTMESAEQVIRAWQGCAEAAHMVVLWDSFVARFGDRSTQEFELSVAHWDEDPSFVLQTMREILIHNRPDPRESLRRQEETGQQAVAEMLQCIRSQGAMPRAWLFGRLVASYRDFVLLRENLKYRLVGRFNSLRKMFLALGRILEQRDWIAECDDIFYLCHEEICRLVADPSGVAEGLKSVLAQRKQEHQVYTQSTAPDIWVTLDGQEMPMNLPDWENVTTLHGIGCSPGRVTGLAYILDTVRGGVAMPPGRILVAPFIDPGLTPLFMTAAGLVTEIGGTLSHGATVAREYGLPAVVRVPHVTRIIKDGQQITVDGFTGVVHLGPSEG